MLAAGRPDSKYLSPHMPTKYLDPALLGKISLARVLEMPLLRFRHFIARVEQSDEYMALNARLQTRLLDGAALADAAPDDTSDSLGMLRKTANGFELRFLQHHYAREYRLSDGRALTELPPAARQEGHFRSLLPKLGLINTRNRLTLALIRLILEEQAAYLQRGDDTLLRPLTQARCASRLQAGGNLDMVVDTSRISRLARNLIVVLPTGNPIPLSNLMPKPRQVHARLIEQIIKREQQWMALGALKQPWTDQAIADYLRCRGVTVLRRTVTDIRHEMAIPDRRHRHGNKGYLSATEMFSSPVILNPQTLKTSVPACPGVYEIRVPSHAQTADPEETPKNGRALPVSNVIYIGSAGNLRKRLGDHLSGRSGNHALHQHIAKGHARMRYSPVNHDWRQVERDLYQTFCSAFGSPPQCNRISP